MFVQILWKSVTFKLPKKKRTIDSPVLTHLSNSVLAGSRVKEIWPRYYIMIVIRDIIPFRKLTGDHFGGNLGSFRAVGIILGAVRSHENDIHSPSRLFLAL